MGKIIFCRTENKKISPRSHREILFFTNQLKEILKHDKNQVDFLFFTNQLKEILKHDKNQVDYPHIINLNIHKFNSVIQIL